MDAIDFFLLRYRELHRRLTDDLLAGLSDAQVRGRPHPGVNTVAWLLWHAARVEDVSAEEGVVAAEAAWLTEFWGAGRSRAWFLAQLPLLHVYGHYFEARV